MTCGDQGNGNETGTFVCCHEALPYNAENVCMCMCMKTAGCTVHIIRTTVFKETQHMDCTLKELRPIIASPQHYTHNTTNFSINM